MDSTLLSDKFKQIEEILSFLEKDDIDIEEAVCKYAKAKEILNDCKNTIDSAEKEVLKLSSSGEVSSFDEDVLF